MKLDIIIPKIIILLSVMVIGICLMRYVISKPEEIISNVNSVEGSSSVSEGTRYVLDEKASPIETDETKMNNTDAQDTSELENLIENLSKQAEKNNIENP